MCSYLDNASSTLLPVKPEVPQGIARKSAWCTQSLSQSLITLGPEGIAHTCKTLVQWDKMTIHNTVTIAAKTNMKTTCVVGKLYFKKWEKSVSESEFDDDRSGSMVDEAFTMFIESKELVELVS